VDDVNSFVAHLSAARSIEDMTDWFGSSRSRRNGGRQAIDHRHDDFHGSCSRPAGCVV